MNREAVALGHAGLLRRSRGGSAASTSSSCARGACAGSPTRGEIELVKQRDERVVARRDPAVLRGPHPRSRWHLHADEVAVVVRSSGCDPFDPKFVSLTIARRSPPSGSTASIVRYGMANGSPSPMSPGRPGSEICAGSRRSSRSTASRLASVARVDHEALLVAGRGALTLSRSSDDETGVSSAVKSETR